MTSNNMIVTTSAWKKYYPVFTHERAVYVNIFWIVELGDTKTKVLAGTL